MECSSTGLQCRLVAYGWRNGGDSQEGWDRAWKMEKDVRREIRDISEISFLCFVWWFTSFIMSLIVLSLFFVIWPLEPTSNGTRFVNQPALIRSVLRSKYLVVFLRWAEGIFFSKLQVSSNILIVLDLLSKMTMSGLKLVAKTSGGMVPPLIWWPGISVYIENIFLFDFFISCVRWLKIESCLHVKRFCFNATGHQFNMCSKLDLFLHMSHLSVLRIPHLLRLSGVFNPFTLLLTANVRMPFGMLFLQ